MIALVAERPQPQMNLPTLVQARRSYVLVMYVLTGLTGISQSLGMRSQLISLLAAALYASASTQWALVDCRLSGRTMLRIKQEIFFFTWPLATLLYLIGTRGWRGLGLWILNVVALYATLYITFFLMLIVLDWVRS